MRHPIENQKKLNEFWVSTLNECFANYIEKLVKDYLDDPEYNIIDGQDDNFIVPGRLYMQIDGRDAYLELTSDVLSVIYQLVVIKNQYMEDRFFGGENIDLRDYR